MYSYRLILQVEGGFDFYNARSRGDSYLSDTWNQLNLFPKLAQMRQIAGMHNGHDVKVPCILKNVIRFD